MPCSTTSPFQIFSRNGVRLSPRFDPHSGGKYHFLLAETGLALRGIYTEFERGERLGFSWKWDHEPSDTTSVTIIWERAQKQGSRLVLNHGSYPLDEDGRKRRQGHVKGWMYFLERLESFTK